MITSLAFIVYPVSDIAAARKFYESALGLRMTHEFGGDWFEYDLGDSTFAISGSDSEHPVPVRGALAAFEVDDLDAETERLKALGILPARPIADTPVCRFVTLRDPDGSEVILHQRKRTMKSRSNKITGANAGGPRQLPMRTRWAARVAQFGRSAPPRQRVGFFDFRFWVAGLLAGSSTVTDTI